jgi:glycosyltransferase involved in cell wall biosynthesis
MVARPTGDRFRLFARSLRGYLAQTYANRELVIVMSHLSDRDRRVAVRHVRQLARPDIRLRFVSGNPALGRLRNIGIDMAAGDFCCQWDDDDIYHPLRLEIQLRAMWRRKRGGAFLQTLLQFFEKERELFIQDWSFNPPPYDRHPGTGIVVKDPELRYPVRGRHARKGEDAIFMVRHSERHGHTLLRTHPYLYVYVYHGTNTWDYDHHRAQARVLAYSREAMRRMRADLEFHLGHLEFPARRIKVMSAEGLAFVWHNRRRGGAGLEARLFQGA